MVIPIETLGDRFEKENPGMEEFDHVAWREYFEKWEKFHTYCLTCMQVIYWFDFLEDLNNDPDILLCAGFPDVFETV